MSMWTGEELLGVHQIGASRNGHGPDPAPLVSETALGAAQVEMLASVALVLALTALAFAFYLYWREASGGTP